MKYIYNLSFLGILAVMCSACKTQIITPAIVPPVEIEAPQPVPTSHSLGIIGAVEPVYVLPMKMPFAGRIDTGAETSSIDASDMPSLVGSEMCIRDRHSDRPRHRRHVAGKHAPLKLLCKAKSC